MRTRGVTVLRPVSLSEAAAVVRQDGDRFVLEVDGDDGGPVAEARHPRQLATYAFDYGAREVRHEYDCVRWDG